MSRASFVVTGLAAALTACGAVDPPATHAPSRPEIATVCAVGGCAPIAPASSSNVESCAARHDCVRDPSTVCDKSSPQACTTRALDIWAVVAADGDMAPVVALLDRACALGDPRGCAYEGRIVLDGVGGGVPDEARGRMLLERACDDELVLACDTLVRLEHDAPPIASERQVGLGRYEGEAACWRGAVEQCFVIALAFGAGRDGYPHDERRSALAYIRACDRGHATSCNNLANDYYYGDGVPVDWARAAHLYEQACDGGLAIGCASIGFLAEYGDGIPLDLKRAEHEYRDACTLGSSYGCAHLDMLAAYRSGVPHAPDKAVARWRSECEAPNASASSIRSCAFYGVMVEDGKGAPRDSARATTLMRRACDAKYKPACDWVAEHS